MKGYITRHFKVSEFDQMDGKAEVPISMYPRLYTLCVNLEVLRKHVGNRRITLTSGWRGKIYNKDVGGADESEHLLAGAGDFEIEGMTPREVTNKIEYLISIGEMEEGGLHAYGKTEGNFTHYDNRGIKARW